MKTTFRFIIASMAAISVFSSCQKELANETVNNATDGVRTISVQFDNSTKASLSGLAPTFTNNDKIRVSNTEKSEECTVTVSGTTATFITTLSGALTAIYPAAAAVYISGTPDGPISSPYFKVSASQDGTIEKAIIAKAEIADGSSSATFIGQTALFEITPPSGATSFTIKSLKQIGTDGQRSGTAAAINDDTDDMKKCEITVAVPTGGKAYVSLVPGVNLTDLSFDAGETYGMKGIPMKDITASGKPNATAANTKYTIGNANNTWHPYVEIEMTVNSVTKKYKWSTMNVGATTAAGNYTTCYGDLYEWGSVTPIYKERPWTSATGGDFTGKWKEGKGSGYSWTTYCGSSSFVEWDPAPYDDTKILKPEKDAATQNWGTGWRMPTSEEFKALYEACGNTGTNTRLTTRGYTTTTAKGIYWCTSYGGVAGLLFITKANGPHLFFPAAGFGYLATLNDTAGIYGGYWSSSLNTHSTYEAGYLYFIIRDDSKYVYPQKNDYRFRGRSVRPVSD